MKRLRLLKVVNKVKNGQSKRSIIFFIAFLCMVLSCFLLILNLMLGEPNLSFTSLLQVLDGQATKLERIVVYEIRFPRWVAGWIAGALLALAGAMLQDALQNELAGPELTGVSAGAAMVMACTTVFNLPLSFALYPLAALIGAILSGLIVITVASSKLRRSSILLVGAAMTTTINALVIVVISIGRPNDIGLLFFYLTGSLANRTQEHVMALLPWFIIGVPLALLSGKALNVFRLGDEAAKARGVSVDRIRLLVFGISATLTAAVVAYCGPIGFVSLIIPHLTRRVVQSTNSYVIMPLSILAGGTFLTGMDLITRTYFYPVEIPVGLLTSIIGGSWLLFMFIKRRTSL
ncbi:hypothetical protein AWH48_02105 [Domibacillus aminovorans]|uniref:ABC transporter permease n=1 Tax=Domibacillus aminovorans TaxID=29332 RepID=A0A177KWR4_9BACI|nr:hypothetical protein AWH48_02105 [Domibacillus aminovorans]